MRNVKKSMLKWTTSISSLVVVVILAFSCQHDDESSPSVAPVVARPDQAITLAKAGMIYHGYDQRFETLNAMMEEKEEARFGWNSIAFFESFLADIERESAKINVKPSGIRFYYAAHPNDEPSPRSGLQGYILVPTYFDAETGNHLAYDPAMVDDHGKPVRIHHMIVKGKPENIDNTNWERQALIGAESFDERISLETAHKMFSAYQDRFNALTKLRGGRPDARYGWHSIEFYKQYLSYLKQESEKVNMQLSGLRIYYTAYPEGTGHDQDGYQNYMFVPTYYDKAAKDHITFDPLHMDATARPKPIHNLILNAGGNFNLSARTEDNPIPTSAANMAQMCEPNCPEE